MSLADRRPEAADKRTEWALERTAHARERTFSAWVRTGLASVATGLGIARLFVSTTHSWLPQASGIIFVLTGGVVFGMAFWRYCQQHRELRQEGGKLVTTQIMGLLTIALIVSTAIALFLVIA
jgi:putative membrane protein